MEFELKTLIPILNIENNNFYIHNIGIEPNNIPVLAFENLFSVINPV